MTDNGDEHDDSPNSEDAIINSEDGLPDPEDVIASGSDDDEDGIGDDLPTPEQIIEAHERVVSRYDLTHTGARVASPRLSFERTLRDVDNYEGTYCRAAALLQKIITAHYFEDGNKRTAWVMTRSYLESYEYAPADTSEGAERVLRSIRLFNVNEIAEWLETGEIDEERFPPR